MKLENDNLIFKISHFSFEWIRTGPAASGLVLADNSVTWTTFVSDHQNIIAT